MYSQTSDKGHSEREQTSRQRTSSKYSYLEYTLYRKSPLKEGTLSTKDKMAGPLIKRFHCTARIIIHMQLFCQRSKKYKTVGVLYLEGVITLENSNFRDICSTKIC